MRCRSAGYENDEENRGQGESQKKRIHQRGDSGVELVEIGNRRDFAQLSRSQEIEPTCDPTDVAVPC